MKKEVNVGYSACERMYRDWLAEDRWRTERDLDTAFAIPYDMLGFLQRRTPDEPITHYNFTCGHTVAYVSERLNMLAEKLR